MPRTSYSPDQREFQDKIRLQVRQQISELLVYGQPELKELGLDRNQRRYIRRIMSGGEPLTLPTLQRLCEAYDLDAQIILYPKSEAQVRFAANLIARAAVPILEDMRNGR